jgi:replicative DNA helicase
VLGSIILLPAVLNDVALIVQPADFYDDAHRKLFEIMLALHGAGRPVDPTLLVERIRAAGDWDTIGGAAYLSRVLNSVPTAAHAAYYAEIVREKSRLRRLIFVCTRALQEAYDELPSHDIAASLESGLLERDQQGSARPIAEVWEQVVDNLQKLVGKPDPPAMLSGLPAADRVGFVFVPGELVILAARPGLGKTSLATQIAMHHAGRGRTVLLASLEMKDEALASRVLVASAGYNHQSIRTHGVDQATVDDLRKARDEFGDVPCYIWSPGRVKLAAIRAMATAMKTRQELRLLVVDYTSWILPDDPRAQRREQVGEIIKGLRSIGQRLAIPVLLLHQLNREGASERPQLQHLRESGCAEEDADIVAFLHRQDDRTVSLIVEKNRQGSRGEVSLLWHPEQTRFEDASIGTEWKP